MDYGGPFFIKDGIRKNIFRKAYIAVFVCLSTKAVHIELVSSLAADAFLACLRRFVARRGIPANIYSDNGTNFTGANNELKKLYKFVNAESFCQVVQGHVEGITWHFIPPRSPHFGGIWEAAIKSVKSHLAKVACNARLSFEELTTLLAQIEAVLNSRPLCPLSPDPNDPQYLTPAHFLTGESLVELADPKLVDLKINSLSRWQHVQLLKQHFWRRWSTEYIRGLQPRTKWQRNDQPRPKVGQLALIRDDNLPTSKWSTGRISQLHTGPDGIVRVVSLQTPSGVMKRAINKIAVLPL